MRLLRVGVPGQERPCVLREDGTVVDVSRFVDDYDGAFLSGGGVERLRSMLRDSTGLPEVDTDKERVGPCVARPPKVVCIGLNYVDHAAESGQAVPTEPVVFYKAPYTVVGPYDDVRIPRGSEKTDYEVELGIVIGAEARYLADEEAARAVIVGYVVSHDVSERAFQLELGGQWVKGKSCETFNPLGPWLVTADEVEDAQSLSLTLTLNGETVQAGLAADRAAEANQEHQGMRDVLRNSVVLRLTAVYFLIQIGFYGLNTWLPTVVKNITGGEIWQVGLVTAIRTPSRW